ncbi:MAG: putative rane protein [Anaerosolibacter sp.]|jgi:hypothetical protein|uniref:ribosomal maturation YjgA family protein n=1 Tax=Anaerosolibacter sp. TaxID=1872527 RepID=UPI0026307957|nr:DUF2809 domain-containing protein [Anaerosolibacter sp.]MDF2546208.1 putative rane protein [Anaerosolibacter sp.]
MHIKKNRVVQLMLWILVILLGLGTRRYGEYMPQVIAVYGGDVLWALMVYEGFGFLCNRASTGKLFIFTLIFSYMIELSQLYQAPWIMSVRRTTFGALILGHGFLWSDLVCYTIGAILGVLIEKYILLRRAN